MKHVIGLMFALAVLSFTACNQTSKEVPSDVTTAFSEKFPDATGVKWDKENALEWEAEFKLNGMKFSANFDQAGTWMETEYVISSTDIPEAVKASLENEYTEYDIETSEVSETPGGIVYEFTLKKGVGKTDVSIDAGGKVLNKEQGEEEEEEAEDD